MAKIVAAAALAAITWPDKAPAELGLNDKQYAALRPWVDGLVAAAVPADTPEIGAEEAVRLFKGQQAKDADKITVQVPQPQPKPEKGKTTPLVPPKYEDLHHSHVHAANRKGDDVTILLIDGQKLKAKAA